MYLYSWLVDITGTGTGIGPTDSGLSDRWLCLLSLLSSSLCFSRLSCLFSWILLSLFCLFASCVTLFCIFLLLDCRLWSVELSLLLRFESEISERIVLSEVELSASAQHRIELNDFTGIIFDPLLLIRISF